MDNKKTTSLSCTFNRSRVNFFWSIKDTQLKRQWYSFKRLLTSKTVIIHCKPSLSPVIYLLHTLIVCPEEGHAALLPSWPAGGQREQLYKSWLYKNTGRRSSWELTLPRQPQTVNYRELTWFLCSPGTSNSQTGSIKPCSLHFRSASLSFALTQSVKGCREAAWSAKAFFLFLLVKLFWDKHKFTWLNKVLHVKIRFFKLTWVSC